MNDSQNPGSVTRATGATRASGATGATDADDGAAETFSPEERAAMKERAKELRAASKRGTSGTSREADLAAVLAKIAEMPGPDRRMAERLHAVITHAAPDLAPKLWYGMPAYAKNGTVLCFFQGADKFKTRYSTLGFNDVALLDDGTMWPTAYALTELTAADENVIAELVTKAVG